MHQALHFWHVFHMFEVRPCPQVAVRTVVVHSALASTVRDTGTLIKVRSTRDPLDTASQFSSAHSTVYCNPRPRSKFSKGGPRPPGPPPPPWIRHWPPAPFPVMCRHCRVQRENVTSCVEPVEITISNICMMATLLYATLLRFNYLIVALHCMRV